MKAPIKVDLLRNSLIESSHEVRAVLFGAKGLIENWGEAELKCFTRSAIKSLQAKVCLGLIHKYEPDLTLTEEEIALACGSHIGEDNHIQTIDEFCNKFDIEETSFKCGTHSSRRGKLNSQLKHNCSGKHALMLLTCKICGFKQDDYFEINHPIQQAIHNEICKLLNLQELKSGRDGCALPSFYLSLTEMAKLFCKTLADESYLKLYKLMSKYPSLIAGSKQLDTEIMSKSRLVTKGGAEGLQLVINTEKQEVLIVKVVDGNNRAKAISTIKNS